MKWRQRIKNNQSESKSGFWLRDTKIGLFKSNENRKNGTSEFRSGGMDAFLRPGDKETNIDKNPDGLDDVD